MLNLLRRGVKTWVAKILLLLLIASFAVWGIGDIFLGRTAETIARVGETEVPAERFMSEMVRQRTALSQQRGELVSFADLRDGGQAGRTIEGLLRDATYAEELSNLGIAVPRAAVGETIMSDPRFHDGQGNFNEVNYSAIINQAGFSNAEFEGLTQALLGQQIMVDAIGLGVPSTPETARLIATFQGETRNIATIALAAADAPDPGLPDDTTLQAHFEGASERFVEPERRSGSYIVTDFAALAAELAPTDEAVRAEYDANPETYTAQATRTVEQIGFDSAEEAQAATERLKSGEATWEEIAAERNVALEDLPLGTILPGELSEAADAAIFSLTEPGIAGPVDGLFGALLMNVTEVELGGLTPFDEIKERIRASMALFAAQERAVELVNQIDDVRAGGAEMAELAEKVGLPLARFEGLNRLGIAADGPQIPLAADPAFIAEIFSADQGEERDVIELTNGSYVLVMVENIVERHLPELDAIRERVIADWQHQQRMAAQEARAAELLTTGASEDFAALAASVSAEITEHEGFSRDAAPAVLSSALVAAVFDASEGDTVIGRNGADDAVLLAELRTVTPLAQADLDAQQNAITDVLANSIARDQLEYFARALESKYGSTVDESAIDFIFEHLSQTRGG